MKVLNLNAYQLSKRTGLNHVTIGRLIHGEGKTMYLSTAFKLADVLGIDINEFREEGHAWNPITQSKN